MLHQQQYLHLLLEWPVLARYSEKRTDSIRTDVKEIVPTNMLASLLSISMLASVLFMFVSLGTSMELASSPDLSIERSAIKKPRSGEETNTTKIISHVFCDACNGIQLNPTLTDVHTYVELKHDPKASLPASFTICSSAMTPFNGNLLILARMANSFCLL